MTESDVQTESDGTHDASAATQRPGAHQTAADPSSPSGSEPAPGTGRAVKRQRAKSAIPFPYEDLAGAAKLADHVFHRFGGTCTLDQLAAASGSTPSSGAFRSRVGAARMFGVLAGQGGHVELGPYGIAVLDDTDFGARADAFLSVPLYQQLYNAYKGGPLPTDAGLEAKIRDLGVPVKQTTTARQVFMRSAEQAGFFLYGRGRLVLPPRGPARSQDDVSPQSDHVDTSASSANSRHVEEASEPEIMGHPLIRGLLAVLPPPGTPFPEAQKQLWLKTLEMNLSFIYPSASES